MKKVPLFLFLLLVLLLMSLLLAACSDQDEPQETVWDDQLKTMDKARQTEQILLDNAEKQRRQIEEETSN